MLRSRFRVVPAGAAGTVQKWKARRLLKMGQKPKRARMPQNALSSRAGETADALAQEATRRRDQCDEVAENELLVFHRRAREGFRERFGLMGRMTPSKRIKFVRCAHPTRNGEAPLLAAYARR